jgi:hypothetical protein
MLPAKLCSLIVPPSSITYALLKEEQKICVEFANEMRALTLQGKMPYIWYHIANEFLPSARINYSFQSKQKHMGKISGLPDYCFMSAKDSFFIEFKTIRGKQSENQKLFEEWCAMNKVDYFLCHSAKQGISLINDRLKTIYQS